MVETPIILNKLVSDPSIAEPIVLEQANVYYEITFNITDNSYSMSTYSIEQAIDPAPHEFGSISLDTWNNGGSWLQEFYFGYMTDAPKNIQRFEQDNINPHLFYLKSLSLKANTQMNFIIHNWHHDNCGIIVHGMLINRKEQMPFMTLKFSDILVMKMRCM